MAEMDWFYTIFKCFAKKIYINETKYDYIIFNTFVYSDDGFYLGVYMPKCAEDVDTMAPHPDELWFYWCCLIPRLLFSPKPDFDSYKENPIVEEPQIIPELGEPIKNLDVYIPDLGDNTPYIN
jgi:hypothetical protein